MPKLTISNLCKEAKQFSAIERTHAEKALYGRSDGKRVGTYLEQKFRKFLIDSGYIFIEGNSASGVDFPGIEVDMKVTSVEQPQSSCPYKSARQKIYGLGYSLIVFVYDKVDNPRRKTGTLNILRTIFVEKHRTGDFQMTHGLRDILERQGNHDDLVSYMMSRRLPAEDIELNALATEVLNNKPEQGYLTMTDALQWRLNYGHALSAADKVPGVKAVFTSSPK